MTLPLWFTVALWSILLAPPGAAKAPVPAAQPLTAGQAVELALESSRTLAALAHRVEEERANVDVALQIDNPQLRLGDFRSDALLMPALQGDEFESPWEGGGFRSALAPSQPGISRGSQGASRAARGPALRSPGAGPS